MQTEKISTLGSTDNAGNSVNLVNGLGFLNLHRRSMLDSIGDFRCGVPLFIIILVIYNYKIGVKC